MKDEMDDRRDEFHVWLLRYQWGPRCEIARFDGGELPEPFGFQLGIYRTEAEARADVEHAPELFAWSLVPKRYPRYDEPCAWVGILTIVLHEAGDGMYYIQPSYGGPMTMREDRDILAIFATREEAAAWAAAKNAG